ncbi:hypothetical protein CTAYLR_006180 [Chrysophaeum taylorii]|uniref:RRM domain-containing protein n=1 Tax=Chrysophaeum taylorii TaxID=2483200 RepID=A0AAD7UNF5_9STRA|nr:hypothetical protein CTAYLR_006180 [Chrysophaeum taylorii]
MKLIVCGDVEAGKAGEAFARIEKINKDKGPFDAVVVAGAFRAEEGVRATVPTYFFEGEENRSIENVSYLGREGIATIKGITVAFLASNGDPQKVIDMASAPGYCGADILATSDWPRGIDVGVDDGTMEAMKAKGVYLNALGSAGPRDALACRPRYHFAGTHDVFWARAPYRIHDDLSLRAPHFTRFVGLRKATGRKWLHAIEIEGIPYCDLAALTDEPPGSTDSPFEVRRKKRRALEEEEESGTLFLGGTPFHTNAAAILAAVNEKIPVQASDVRRPSKSFAFVDFANPEDAARAREVLAGGLRVDGRCLQVDWATSSKRQKYPEDHRTECWFCLASPSCADHLVVAVGDSAYVAMPKGPLVDSHALVVPIDHIPILPDVKDHARALGRCFKDKLRALAVAFERFAPTTKKGVYHAHLQVVPVAGKSVDEIRDAFARHATTFDLVVPAGGDEGRGNTIAPFFHVDVFDGDEIVLRLRNEGAKVPLHFGRLVCAHLLGQPHKVHWKACELPRQEEARLCEAFKAIFVKDYFENKKFLPCC